MGDFSGSASESTPVVIWANPDRPELQMQQMMDLYGQTLDQYNAAQARAMPQFEAQYQQLLQQYAPQRQQLTQDMLAQYGTGLQDLLGQLTGQATEQGNQLTYDQLIKYGVPTELARQAVEAAGAGARTGAEAGLLRGSGADLVAAARAAEDRASPEWASLVRAAGDTGSTLSNYLLGLSQVNKPLDESGAMSEGEREEITRGLNRTNLKSGLADSGSMLGAISNALTFGNAGRQRAMENRQANLATAGALGQAGEFIAKMAPATQTRFDPYTVGTGKTGAATYNAANPYSAFSPTGLNYFTGLSNTQGVGAYGTQQTSDLLGIQSDIWKQYQQLKNTPYIGQKTTSGSFSF